MHFSTRFVCEDFKRSTYEKAVRAPIFRKIIKLCNPQNAEILLCGLGFYDLYVNGTKITKGYLAPYIANSNHYIYYDRYNLLPYIAKGENEIQIWLGDGFQNGKTEVWNFVNNSFSTPPVLALTLEIIDNGKTQSYEADDFMCAKGPIWFNDYRMGVFYDARLEQDLDWHKPILHDAPKGVPKICEAEPIKIYKELEPVSITKGELAEFKCSSKDADLHVFEKPTPKSGGFIYDFGENNAGTLRLKIKGFKGQRIDIQCGEQLWDGKLDYNNIHFMPDGYAQRDIYIAKGDETEEFEFPFVFHGFRYAYVHGITEEQANNDLLTYLVMSSDLEDSGNFQCSDTMANKIYEMGKRSNRSNFYYFPMDCPQREKNGWTGDASASAEHMILTMDTVNSWREWLHNIRAAQTDKGELPGIVPTDTWGYEWGNGPAWDSVLFNLPYFAYKYRGNTDIVKENAVAMLKYLKYIESRQDEKGIINFGLGDWVPVGKPASYYDAPLGFTNGVMVYDMCQKATEMFQAIGLSEYAVYAEQLGIAMRKNVRKAFVNTDTLMVQSECQTAQAMAIFYNIFDVHEKQKAFSNLMQIIKRDNDNFTCGFLGLRVLFHVLADYGQVDLAYKMITKPDFPSYGYWVETGETTFLEAFRQYDGAYQNSKNHHFLGDVINFFMCKIGGIRVQNKNFVQIKPCAPNALSWCKTSHKLPNGEIEVYWEKTDTGITVDVKTKGNVNYEII